MPKSNDETLDLLKQCAYININKMPGNSTSGNLEKEYSLWKEIINEQIETYNPDIIIFGGTFDIIKKVDDFFIADACLISKTPTNVAHLYQGRNGRLLLNAMHPAQTTVGHEWYVDEIVDAIRKYCN